MDGGDKGECSRLKIFSTYSFYILRNSLAFHFASLFNFKSIFSLYVLMQLNKNEYIYMTHEQLFHFVTWAQIGVLRYSFQIAQRALRRRYWQNSSIFFGFRIKTVVDAFMTRLYWLAIVLHFAPVCAANRGIKMKSCLPLALSRGIPFVGARREEKCDESLLAACVLTAATLYPRPPRFKAKSGLLARASKKRASYNWAFVSLPPRLCLLGALILAPSAKIFQRINRLIMFFHFCS
jgi:hypothetical protein